MAPGLRPSLSTRDARTDEIKIHRGEEDPMFERRTYDVIAVKRQDGRTIEGTTVWDGLNAIMPVITSSGEVVYVSSLDTIIKREVR